MPKILTDANLLDIRQLLRDGVTHQQIADDFGVARTTITNVATREGITRYEFPGTAPDVIRGLRAQLDDQPWADEALCAQTDPESFFPEKGGSTKEAKATCAECLVRAECLDYALANDERFGVWGGLSERERRRLSKHTATT